MPSQTSISLLLQPIIMHKIFFIVFAVALFIACDSAKEKAKNVINKAGETAGAATTEFAKGVKEGIDKSLDCELQLSAKLKDAGISSGKFTISSSSDSGDNVLTAYLIFSKDVQANISVKVFDSKGLEYGRTAQTVSAKSGEAKFIDFIFDKRTDIESKSRFVME